MNDRKENERACHRSKAGTKMVGSVGHLSETEGSILILVFNNSLAITNVFTLSRVWSRQSGPCLLAHFARNTTYSDLQVNPLMERRLDEDEPEAN